MLFIFKENSFIYKQYFYFDLAEFFNFGRYKNMFNLLYSLNIITYLLHGEGSVEVGLTATNSVSTKTLTFFKQLNVTEAFCNKFFNFSLKAI